MDELVAWLRLRIAEDVERTKSGHPFNDGNVHDENDYWVEPNNQAWHTDVCGWRVGEGLDSGCTCGVPDQVLARCESYTRILDEVVPEVESLDLRVDSEFGSRTETDGPAPAELLVKLIAIAYQHHPEYREEWRP